MNKALGIFLTLLVLATTVAAGEHHDDDLRQARTDLETAEDAARSKIRVITFGALWGLALGAVVGVSVTLALKTSGGGR